ncbi:MAG: VOC family protein [Armatimonadetes bacterium]|nr:VOC family protein [Armatimonadota bacterium]
MSEVVAGQLKLPDACQVCVVVRDLDAAVAYHEKVLGMGPFVRPEIEYSDKVYRGQPIPDSKWRMAFCSLGPIELELSQPVWGPNIYDDFLKERGEGLHHIGFDVPNLDAALESFAKLGISPIMVGRTPHGGFAHMDTSIHGLVVEIFQRPGRRA